MDTTTPHPHFTFDSNIERMYMENLHPRIIQDMKAFNNVDDDNDGYARRVGLEFLYDLPPQPLPLPQSDTYPMAGVNYQDASIYGTDLFVHPFSVSTSTSTNMSAGDGYQQSGTGLVAPTTLSHGPPVLDTTWQSFVEQLGFWWLALGLEGVFHSATIRIYRHQKTNSQKIPLSFLKIVCNVIRASK